MRGAIRFSAACVLALCCVTSSAVLAAKGSRSKSTHASTTRCSNCPRSSHGRIARSRKAVHEFEVQTGYPKGRPGYVVDHIVPLACGGADASSNMQWQTVAAAKAKDKIERRGC